jgi:hypothetical protein
VAEGRELVFNSADHVEPYTIFDRGGNNFRLIAVIHYNRQKVSSGICSPTPGMTAGAGRKGVKEHDDRRAFH